MASRSTVWMKERGTAGKPGGNREHTPHPEATTRTERGAIASDRQAEVSSGPTRHTVGVPQAQPVGRRVHRRLDRGHAPAPPLERPVAERRGEAAGGASGGDAPVGEAGRMERVVERGNLLAALARVQRKGGSPGVDGRTVDG
jgi:hypothetical protein